MTVELITFKLEHNFLNEIDMISKEAGYSNRTDFIRNALREKLEEIKLKKAMIELSRMKGKAKKKVTDKEIHQVRETLAIELAKKFR